MFSSTSPSCPLALVTHIVTQWRGWWRCGRWGRGGRPYYYCTTHIHTGHRIWKLLTTKFYRAPVIQLFSEAFLMIFYFLAVPDASFGPASSVLAFEATMISAWPNHEWLMLMQVGKDPPHHTVAFRFHIQYKRCHKKNTVASIASSFNLETSPTRSPGRPVANPWEWPQLPQQGAPIFFNRKSCHTCGLWKDVWGIGIGTGKLSIIRAPMVGQNGPNMFR